MISKKKKEYVWSVHRTKIQEQKGVRKNGNEYIVFATRPNGEKKYMKCATYDGLIEKLYDYYAGTGSNLSNTYQGALKWKSGTNVAMSTLRRLQNTWNSYFSSYDIINKRTCEITTEDWTAFFENIIMKHSLTKKQFGNVRDVVSMIMKYAMKNKIITHNTTRDVLYDDLSYKPDRAYNSVKVIPFTENEARAIVAWCVKQTNKQKYAWAVVLNLVLGLRYAELCALKWSDIDFLNKTITVADQLAYEYELDDEMNFVNNGKQPVGHMKGYEEKRILPMTGDVEDALRHLTGLDDTYVLPNFRYHTYCDFVKECACAVGLDGTKYRTHSLRATAAKLLYIHTHDIYQVQTLLGHTNPQMTMKYIKDLVKEETLKETMLSDGWQELRTTADHPKASQSLFSQGTLSGA